MVCCSKQDLLGCSEFQQVLCAAVFLSPSRDRYTLFVIPELFSRSVFCGSVTRAVAVGNKTIANIDLAKILQILFCTR